MGAIDNAFRHELGEGDVTSDGLLSADALAGTLDTIEVAHARALRRRREQIFGSVTQKLRMEGCECQPADDWCILATRPGSEASGLFWVTPRRPATEDFFGVSQQLQRVTEQGDLDDLKGVVVHESGRLADDYQEVLGWALESLWTGTRDRGDMFTLRGCRMINLARANVLLSASFPSGERGKRFKPYDPSRDRRRRIGVFASDTRQQRDAGLWRSSDDYAARADDLQRATG